jgi:metal-dependent amidase/aminoacylase/carboxypeptidase family protein
VRYLRDHREFDGTVVLIFQPTKEAESGGLALVQDGLMDRFCIQKGFGVHNIPKIPVGHFAIRTGGISAMTGATASLTYTKDLPVAYNDRAETKTAHDAAASLDGPQAIDADTPPIMGGEDFSFMLAERPGALMFIGNGDSAPVHNQAYDFNDDAIPYGCAYFADIVENQLAQNV